MLIAAEDGHFEQLIAGVAPEGLRLADGGVEAPEVLSMLRDLATSVRAQFDPAAWMIVEEGEIVGLCSLLGAPDADGVAPIGYGVAAIRRRRGVAQRAVADLLLWARGHGSITAISAETAVHNVASQRLLESNGFARIGSRSDPDDGDLYCWRASTVSLA